jgi:hypothetical protein
VLPALAGGAAVAGATRAWAGPGALPSLPRGAGAVAAVAAALLLVPAVDNWARRHALTEFDDHRLVRWFVEQPGFEDGDDPVAQTPILDAALAGDRLRHELPLVTADEGCARILARAGEGWVVVRSTPVREWESVGRPVERCLRARLRPRYEDGLYRVYRAD